MPDSSPIKTDSCFDCRFLCMEYDTRFVYCSQKVWPGVRVLGEPGARYIESISVLAQVCGQLQAGFGLVLSSREVRDEVRRLL